MHWRSFHWLVTCLASVIPLGLAAAAPAQEPLMPIAAAIQDLDGDEVPDRNGEAVRVQGTITSAPIGLGPVGSVTYLQADAGVVLYSPEASTFDGLRPGDIVGITGVVGHYRGQEQIWVTQLERLGAGRAPAHVAVPIADLDERFSAQLISVTGRLEVVEDPNYVLGRVVDATGEITVLFQPSLLVESERLRAILRSNGRHATIRGVLLQDNVENLPAGGYYVLPLVPEDLDLPSVVPLWQAFGVGMLVVLAMGVLWLSRRRRSAEREARRQTALADRLKASEAALREGEKRYRSLVDSVPLGLFQESVDGRILAANPALIRLLAYEDLEDLVRCGSDGWYRDPEDRLALEEVLRTGGAVENHEAHWIRKDGAPIVVRLQLRAVRASGGGIEYREGVVEDLTARREAEARLRAAETRVGQVVAASPTIIYVVESVAGNADMTWISTNVTDILGYPHGDVCRLDWWMDAVHPDDRQRVVRAFRRFLQTEPVGASSALEYRFRHFDGGYRWFRNDLRIAFREGEVVHGVGASLDVTREKEMRLALAEADARYRRLVETSPYGIVQVDERGVVVEANAAVGVILDRDPAQLIGLTTRELIAPESRGAVRQQVELVQADAHHQIDYDAWIRRPSGERRLVHIRSTPIYRDELVIGAQSVVRDITQERLREDRLRLLGAALENLGHGVAVADGEGNLIYSNTEFSELLAVPLMEHPTSLAAFLPDEAAASQMAEIAATLAATGKWSGRIWRRRRDGRVIPLDAVIGQVPAPDGGLPYTLTICHDASTHIDREQQLRRAERLNSLGRLLGGIAHELNNPLNAIINFAALLLAESDSEQVREDLATIVKEGERAAKIVANLRLIARQAQSDHAQKERLDLNEVIEQIMHLRAPELARLRIRLDLELAPGLPQIWADRGQMEQVFLNIVVNAEQAIAAYRPDGSLRVATAAAGVGIRVDIADDGPGIPSSHIDRIFDPFWTTKPPGEGTGLGLSLVHNIVHEHGGSLGVASEVGGGTRFRIELPIAEIGQQIDPGQPAEPRALSLPPNLGEPAQHHRLSA